MNILPSISAHIDEKIINKVIQDNFASLAPSFFTLTSNWFVRAYEHYKDIDKFVIIIYLIHQDLIYFRQNGVKIDYDTFSGLSNEVKSKFKKIRPKTMGQALRIDGITPAAVYILLSHLKRRSIKLSLIHI